MAMRDLYNHLKVTTGTAAISGNAGTTAETTATIDMQGYNSLLFTIDLGVISDADATFAVTMSESDDSGMSGSNAVAAADLIGTYAGAGFQYNSDGTTRKIGYKGSKRYVTLTITPTANTGAWLYSVLALQGKARHFPAGVTQTP